MHRFPMIPCSAANDEQVDDDDWPEGGGTDEGGRGRAGRGEEEECDVSKVKGHLQ